MNTLLFNIRLLWKFWKILAKRKFILDSEVSTFEKHLAQYFRMRHALGVASGTDALIFALKALDISPGDEVIVPAFGFFSTAGAVTWINARPVFVDISLPTFHIDPALIEDAITPRTRAIIISHLNGVVIEIEKISDIAKRHNLFLVEDYAQALGSFPHKDQRVRYGDIVCLSFNPTKIIHAFGDGGALLTDNDSIAEKIRRMRMYGTNLKELGTKHYTAGTASRLGVWNAAALNLQFEQMDSLLSKRRENYFYYLERLSAMKGVILPNFVTNPAYTINGYRFVVLTEGRESLFAYLKKNNVDAHINYGAALPFMPAFSYLEHVPGSFPVAEQVAKKALTLPTDASLGKNEIQRIVKLMEAYQVERARLVSFEG